MKQIIFRLVLANQPKIALAFEPLILTILIVAFAIVCYNREFLLIIVGAILCIIYCLVETVLKYLAHNEINEIIKELNNANK